MSIENDSDRATYGPCDYDLDRSENAVPFDVGRAPPTSAIAAPPAPTLTLNCYKDCVGSILDPNWCKANCPCFQEQCGLVQDVTWRHREAVWKA